MRKLAKRARWLLVGAVLFGGGCASTQQWYDFARSEVARVVADLIGRSVQLNIQSTTVGTV